MRRKFAKKTGHGRVRRGFSLLDVIIASVVLLIAILGASAYRYYSAIDARKAKMQTEAARIAQLLCESWRGDSNSVNTFNPTAWAYPDMTIAAGTGPAEPSGFTKLASYAVTTTTDKFTYYATLSYQNISASPSFNGLNINVAWSISGGSTTDKSFVITSYK